MAIGFNKSQSVMGALRRLDESSSLLSRVFERLSSGLRINRASDDAAGLAVATGLNADARVYGQALRNTNDAISLLNIADSALSQLSDITTRQKELAEQAANGVYTITQRRALDREADALVQEFNRIIDSSTFNQLNVIGNGVTNFRMQLGYGSSEALDVSIGDYLARVTGDGTFAAARSQGANNSTVYDVATGDFTGDGITDFVTAYSGQLTLYRSNGDGTFAGPQDIAIPAGAKYHIESGDINNDGLKDVLVTNSTGTTVTALIGNGDGTFRQGSYNSGTSGLFRSYMGDFNGDGFADVVRIGSAGSMAVAVILGNSDGSFKAGTSFFSGSTSSDTVTVHDFNGDGKTDFAVGDFATGKVLVHYGNGNGSFQGPITLNTGTTVAGRIFSGDLNGDGLFDILTNDTTNNKTHIFLSNSDGSFRAPTSYSQNLPVLSSVEDFNGDGLADIATTDGSAGRLNVMINNGDGTFKSPTSYTLTAGIGNGIATGDFNNDGALDIVAPNFGATSVSVFMGNTQRLTHVNAFDLTTVEGSRQALVTLDATQSRISLEQAKIGAYQSRLQFTERTLQSRIDNYKEAASRIMDVDFAEETARLVSTQILQQAAAAVLVQANQEPSLIMKLLEVN